MRILQRVDSVTRPGAAAGRAELLGGRTNSPDKGLAVESVSAELTNSLAR